MKKFLLISLMFILSAFPAISAEDAFDDVDTTNYGHTTQNLKHFSEKEYQNAIQQYKNKFQKPKKIKKKDIKTYTTPADSNELTSEFKSVEEILNHKGSIMIPANCLSSNGQPIGVGYYSLEYYEDKNGCEWLILSQGSRKVAKIPTKKSTANNDEETINYAYAIGKGDTIKLLYGNIDVAVEAVLDVVE